MAVTSNTQNTSYAVFAPDQASAVQYANQLGAKYGAPYTFVQNPSGGFSVQPQYEGSNGIPLTQSSYNAQYTQQPTSNTGTPQMTADQINQAIQTAVAKNLQPAQAAPVTTPNIDWKAMEVPSISTFEQSVAKDPAIIAYYAKLFKDAQGNTDEAIRRMKYDYDTGIRRINEDTATKTTQEQQDLTSALSTLGITTQKETEGATDTLNKRGIALTQSNPGQALGVGIAGQSGTEMSRLKESQDLRQEALQRNTQRNITELGLNKERAVADTSEKQTEATADINKQTNASQQSLAQQQQQDVLQRAQLAQSEDAAKKSLTLQQQQFDFQKAHV